MHGCPPVKHLIAAGVLGLLAAATMGEMAGGERERPLAVNVDNFVRAETDEQLRSIVDSGGFGRLFHRREPPSPDDQSILRMNRDTLYSAGVFDLDAGPVTVELPAADRFMSLQLISQDHYSADVVYAPARRVVDRETVGTRYALVLVRTFANMDDPRDLALAHTLQDAISIAQETTGTFAVPPWDLDTRTRARDALRALGALGGTGVMFGTRDEVDPVSHLIGTAAGWGGNPPSAAVYQSVTPRRNDGETVHELTMKDVPVDGFWSITVYDADGYLERGGTGALSVNDRSARPNADGSYTIRFGGCAEQPTNCLAIMPDWNYTVRLYRPHRVVLDGEWTVPEAEPIAR